MNSKTFGEKKEAKQLTERERERERKNLHEGESGSVVWV